MASIIQDLFDANDWATCKWLDSSRGLSDEELDWTQPMGFGSLRNTIFHVLEAERMWYERISGMPWRPFQTDAAGMCVSDLSSGLAEVAGRRNDLIEAESANGFTRVVTFQDSKKTPYSQPVGSLLLHLANHTVHHRAQIANFLRHFGRPMAIGWDYTLYCTAYPSLPWPVNSIDATRAVGLETAVGSRTMPDLDQETLKKLARYQSWCGDQIMSMAHSLTDQQLDEPFEIGAGSLRKILQHIVKVQRWWLWNCSRSSHPFDSTVPENLGEIAQQWHKSNEELEHFVSLMDQPIAEQIVEISPAGTPLPYRAIEGVLQVCMHGTYHRAQCINLLRRLGAQIKNIDILYWLPQAA